MSCERLCALGGCARRFSGWSCTIIFVGFFSFYLIFRVLYKFATERTTSNGGSLGSHVDEDRSKVRHSVANCRIQ